MCINRVYLSNDEMDFCTHFLIRLDTRTTRLYVNLLSPPIPGSGHRQPQTARMRNKRNYIR
ncbi:hypothetical protein Lalb_Chr11g0071181 [Lupinus albus]|uniref:Uncharacterized protein n=1 Tax=Lupinus albus TaxID=3870 RepID=A0A6A4PRU9_LUPAL|nr:hypothetical protein Lalb_Chr11g0071181 [Lupinus albus]